jgi:outer membrane protein OmpA-like peptidoglycan-associated protein
MKDPPGTGTGTRRRRRHPAGVLATSLLLVVTFAFNGCAGAASNTGRPATVSAAPATEGYSLPTSPPLTGQLPVIGVLLEILPRAHTLGTPVMPTPGSPCLGFTVTAALFDDNSPTLRADSGAALDEVARQLEAVGGAISIIGYTDTQPATFPGGNQALSEDRARSVRDALASRGVTDIVDVEGRGAAEPVDLGTTQAAYSRNRRVEVTVDCRP